MMRREILTGIAAAAVLLVAVAVLRYAQSADVLTAETATRATQVIVGLWLASYANRMPKQICAWSSSMAAAARAQTSLRVGGWLLTLGGLAHAALWAVAPLDIARPAARAVVATATIVTAVYTVWTFATCRRARRPNHV
jgi:hypothetical protein